MPRRGENIYKRKDGRWEARYIKEMSVDGTKKYGSVYAKTYNEVKAKQQMLLLSEKTKRNLVIFTVSDTMYEWLESNKNQVKITSYQKYKSTIEKHIIPELGKVQIQFLTSVSIQQYTDILLSKEISRTTVNDILIVLGMGLSYAEEEYNLHIPKIALVKNPTKEMRVLSVSEQNVFVEYLLNKNDVFSFGMLLALFTGLRIKDCHNDSP